jgi:tripartite-type tricarboxylate transporter receptor subunit TctC
LSTAVNRALKYPDVVEKVSAQHITPLGSTPEELARKIAADLQRWTAVAKAANIQPQ